MARVKEDYIGKRYSTWVVESIDRSEHHARCSVKCQKCGTIRDVRLDVLKSKPPICDCHPRVNDYTGRIFGYLTVKSKNNDGTYKCECECGNIIDVSSDNLRLHTKMSCGCKKQGAKLLPRICRQCGKTFDGGPRAWYCPDCRRIRAAESKKRTTERRKNGTIAVIGGKMLCDMCGAECIRNSANQRYCADCAKINECQKVREQSLRYYHENADIINPKRYQLRRIKFESGKNRLN